MGLDVAGGLVTALFGVSFTITWRLMYRLSRDLTRLAQRVSYLEGQRDTPPPHHHRMEDE